MRKDITLDPFNDFRLEMEKTFCWLHGYNSITHDQLLEELREHDINDPTGRILSLYGIKPSDESRTEIEMIEKHIQIRKKLEKVFVEVMIKISTWNTYFGINYVKVKGDKNNSGDEVEGEQL